MAYFDELLQRAITVRNNRAPASNTADLVGGVLVGIVTALQMLLDDKQDELTFDTAPTADSQNPVTSDGIYQALQAIDLSACEKIVNKVTSINAQSTDVQYPTAKLLYDSLQALSGIYAAIVHTHAIADIINLQTELDARQLVSNLVTAITAQSTDQQYPSAKLLYDQLQGLAAVYAPKEHTHPFADIERPANVANVNAQGYTITTAYYSHVLTITADATLHLPTMQSGAAIILRLTIIQDATGGRAVTFDGGAALVFNPYQTDLSLGQANYRCWVVLWFDGVNWAWLASPYVLRAESQFAYTIDGTTGGQYVTVTINGTTMQIQATGGVWQYGYNNQINSIAFTGDTGVLNVDFTNSDGLANITTLADAFKNCAALVAVDFTGCDLSNVATAADCFAGCTSLAALTIPTGTWKPDIDLSACAAFTKAAMLAVIDGLYTYASGTHTVTFNSTAWDALSQADQQQVYNAADAKGWTTNAVAFIYVVRGTSSNINGQETFNIQYIQDGANLPDAVTTETVQVAADGSWEFEYSRKKIYKLEAPFGSDAGNVTTITTLNFSAADDFSRLVGIPRMCWRLVNLTYVNFANQTFENCIDFRTAFYDCAKLTTIVWSDNLNLDNAQFIGQSFGVFQNCALLSNESVQKFIQNQTFASLQDARNAFYGCTALTALNFAKATFENLRYTERMFSNMANLQSLLLPYATFASVTHALNMFVDNGVTNISMPNATFGNCTDMTNLFLRCVNATSISMPNATFASATNQYNVRGIFYGCTALQSINWQSATLQSILYTGNIFYGCTALQNIAVPTNSTAIAQTATPSNTPINARDLPLTYQSMVNLASWVRDFSGQSAHSMTFKTSAWNALTAAEQSNIDTILSGKNWTRVLG